MPRSSLQAWIAAALAAVVIFYPAGISHAGDDDNFQGPPIVLTVHGLLPNEQVCNRALSSVLPELCLFRKAMKDYRPTDPSEQLYFYSAINSLCGGSCGTVLPFFWGGDMTNSRGTVEQLKEVVLAAGAEARSTQRPFIIMAHSWGSVLTAQALAELQESGPEERNSLVVHKLITMGSPLFNKFYPLGLAHIYGHNFYQTPRRAAFVRYWTNYHTPRDIISSVIPQADQNILIGAGTSSEGARLQEDLAKLESLETSSVRGESDTDPAELLANQGIHYLPAAAQASEDLRQLRPPFSTVIWHAAYYSPQKLVYTSLGTTSRVDEASARRQEYFSPEPGPTR